MHLRLFGWIGCSQGSKDIFLCSVDPSRPEPRYFVQKWVESITRVGGWRMKRSRFTEEQIIAILRELEAIIARPSARVRLRQRHRADRHGGPALVPGDADRVALHCARQADPERLHRELQWPSARRTPQRDAVHVARAALAAWMGDYNNFRPHSSLGDLTPSESINRSACRPQRGGTLRCGLRAPPRCSNEPVGLKCHRDSTFRRMKVGAQVMVVEHGAKQLLGISDQRVASSSKAIRKLVRSVVFESH